MRLSVVVPAYNEGAILAGTLEQLKRSARAARGTEVELIVVDNGSTDATSNVAIAGGARVVDDPIRRGIGHARNAGAQAASGDVLVFVDADVSLPDGTLARIARAMSDEACLGGALDTEYRPKRRAMQLYLRFWRGVGLATGMAQGACQFYRRETFSALGGYDERTWMGEDVELWWRLKRDARRRGARVEYVRDVRVRPSCRRYDQCPLWRTLVLTNPAATTLLARSRRAWSQGWYESPPR